ncbi:hypothetical protein MFIFM68171_02142 [Madurella fahalii]|uniref:GRF-type domain-containing protein n=1 Tax=Madurella fahalii TaxID=1157608 RepID=A0ABQ0G2D6_9PEZI
MPLHRSTFENGSLRDGKWFCACDNPALWYDVKKEGPTQGQRFLRCCPTDSRPQCSFFLWEVHEASARERLNERSSLRATTPTSTSTLNNALYLPTPGTADPGSTLPTRARGIPRPDDTPTRSRGKAAVVPPVEADGGDEDDGDDTLTRSQGKAAVVPQVEADSSDEDDRDDNGTLLPQIITCLKSDGVQLKPSTKEYLGHLVRQQGAIYEVKLQNSDYTIARLRKRLDRLTVKANHDVLRAQAAD